MPLVVGRGVRSNVPVLVYLFATLLVVAPMRRALGTVGVVRDPVFWSAVSLIYVGPLTVLVSRQLGVSATLAGIGCLCAGAASLGLLMRAQSKETQKSPGLTGPRIALAALGISLFMGSLLSGTISTSYYRDLPTYYALLIAGIVVGSSNLTRRFLGGAMWAILATCLGSLALYVASPDLVTTNFTSISSPLLHAGRLTGPFGHPNAIGSLSAIGAALSLTHLEGKLRYVAYSFCLVAVFLSDQRSALIAALICGLLHIAWPAQHSALTWLRTNLLALAVIVLLLTNVLNDYVSDILNRREASVESRQQVYDYVLSRLDEILPFGIGINGLYDRTQGILSQAGFSHAHNAWLSFLVAGGLLGGICFILLTVLAIAKCVHPHNRRHLPALMTVILLGLAESPTYAGSNWTIISVSAVAVITIVAPLATRNGLPAANTRTPLQSIDSKQGSTK